jgi:AcrR family transcriptional regulator
MVRAASVAGNTDRSPRAAESSSRQRKTQAERSSLSREKIIAAATSCLCSVGYAATTVHLIARTAQMTTGRLQHQFATKADVMAAVIREIQRENILAIALSGLKEEAPLARLREYLRHLAAVFDRRDVVAIYEIRLALKGDEELDRVVGPLLREADETSFTDLESLIVAVGVPNTDARMWRRLMLSALRGAALERVAGYGSGKVPILPSLEQLADMLVLGDTARR